jgi:hypothetical protein
MIGLLPLPNPYLDGPEDDPRVRVGMPQPVAAETPVPPKISFEDALKLAPPAPTAMPAEPQRISFEDALKMAEPAPAQAPAMSAPGVEAALSNPAVRTAMGAAADLSRFRENAADAFRQTGLGAVVQDMRRGQASTVATADLDRAIADATAAGSDVGLDTFLSPAPGAKARGQAEVSPYAGVPLDQLRVMRERTAKEAETRRAVADTAEKEDRARFEAMPAAGLSDPVGAAAALAGQLAGSIPTPENFIPVGRGANAIRTFAKGGAAAGLTNAAVDPVVQAKEIERGVRKEYSPEETALSSLMGFAIGGAFNVAPEVWQAARGWLRRRFDKPADQLTPAEAQAAQEAASTDPELQRILAEAGYKPDQFSSPAAAQQAAERIQRRRDLDSQGRADLQTDDVPRFREPAIVTETDPRTARAVEDEVERRMELERAVEAGDVDASNRARPAQRPDDPIYVVRGGGAAPPGTRMDELRAGRVNAGGRFLEARREARDAFDVAEARRGRYEDAVATEARTDVPQPRQDMAAGGRPEGADRQEILMVGGTPVQMAGRTADGRLIVDPYDPRTGDPIPDGRPFVVRPNDITTRRWSPTERMAQDFEARAETPPRGVGRENPGPREATDRTGSRLVAGLRGETLPPDPPRAGSGPERPEPPTIDGTARRMYEEPAYDRPAGPDTAPLRRIGADRERLDYEARETTPPDVDDAPPSFEPRGEINGQVVSGGDPGAPDVLAREVADARAVTGKKKLPPELRMGARLSDFIANRGGVRETLTNAGDVRSLGAIPSKGEKGGRIGLINNKTGRDLDELTLDAWENGYFPDWPRDGERPPPTVLVEALREDLGGRPRYSIHDEDANRRIQGLRDFAAELDSAVPDWRDRRTKPEDIRARLSEARSFEEAVRIHDDMMAAIEDDYARLAREAEMSLAEKGDAWEPDIYVDSATREYRTNAEQRGRRTEGQGDARNPRRDADGERPEAQPAGEGGGPRAGREGEGGDGGAGGRQGPLRTETVDTVDGPREQGILPAEGFERSRTGGAAAQAGADAPMRGRTPQKDPGSDGGLFDEGAGKQADIFDDTPRRPGPDDGFTLGALGDWNRIARTMWDMGEGVAGVVSRGVGRILDLPGIKELGGGLNAGVGRVWDAGRTALLSNDTILRGLAKKYQSPTLDKIADAFHARAGRGEATGRTFHEAVHMHATQRVQRITDLMGDLSDNPEEQRAIRDLIVNPRRNTGRTRNEQIAAEIGRILKDELEYRRDAGESIGNVPEGYFPRIFDTAKVLGDEAGFVRDVAKLYRAQGVDAEVARLKAAALYQKIVREGQGIDSLDLGFQVNPVSVARTATQSRVFGREADQVLSRFYNDDVFETLVAYFNGAARSAEQTRRFGVKGREGSAERRAWEKEHGKGVTQLEVMEEAIRREVAAAGRDPADVFPDLAKIISSNMGTLGANTTRKARGLISGLHTWNILATMDRSLFTSISELGMLGMRTGSVRAQIKGIGEALREYTRAVRKAEPTEARRWAESLGVVNDAIVEAMLQSRVSGLADSKLTSKLNAGFFKATTLHQWTEGTRVAAVTAGREMIGTLARDLDKGGRKAQRAAFFLKELGVEDPKAFSVWMRDNDFAPDIATVTGDKGQAAIYGTALGRFVNQTIMNPTRAEKPRWASHPVGSLFYGLLSFTYSFQKNVINRQGNLLAKAIRDKDPSLMAGAAIGMPVMFAITAAVEEHVRPALFGKSPRAKEETPVQTALKVVDRAGWTGILSPIINAVTGLKYERDLATSGLGPALGSMAEGAGSVLGLAPKAWGGRNVDTTDTAEHKAIRTAYRLVIEPVADALAVAGAGGAARSAGVYALGHRRDEDAFVGAASEILGLSRPEDKQRGRGERRERRERKERVAR